MSMKNYLKMFVIVSAALYAVSSTACAELTPEAIELCRNGASARIWMGFNTGELSVTEKNERGTTPLMFMAGSNTNPGSVSAAIYAGAKVNGRDCEGRTPLMYAADSNGNPEIVKTLLDAGARVNDRDINGNTALMLAARHTRTPDIISLLLAAGADTGAVNAEGLTAFTLAGTNDSLKGTDSFWELDNRHWENMSMRRTY